ncbi:hypothetical protein DITRI_Ditri17bG0120400 [Diplodiscus trichospermus]
MSKFSCGFQFHSWCTEEEEEEELLLFIRAPTGRACCLLYAKDDSLNSSKDIYGSVRGTFCHGINFCRDGKMSQDCQREMVTEGNIAKQRGMDQINHFLHSHPLALTKEAEINNEVCTLCHNRLADPFYGVVMKMALVFHCINCDFKLDVKCALLPSIDSKGADKIKHYAHGHPLSLRESKEFDNEVWCRGCGENCSALCFGCERCNFFLHQHCAVEFPLETEIHHPFHPAHPLTLSPDPWGPDQCPARDGRSDKFMLLPSLITSKGQSSVDCRATTKDEENSALEGAIVGLNDEIAVLSAKEKPLEAEIKKYRAILETLGEEIKPIKQGLGRLKKIHLRYSNQLNLNRNENKHPD